MTPSRESVSPHPNFLRAYLSGHYDEGRDMPAIDHDAVDRTVEKVAEPYTGPVRVTPRTGPGGDRTVVQLPDGASVVVGPDGEVVADSRALFGSPGYDPAHDALLIETCDQEWVLVAPWRYASGGEGIGHLPRDQALELLEPVRAWHRNFHGDDEHGLRLWELRRGQRLLVGPLHRVPNGWE